MVDLFIIETGAVSGAEFSECRTYRYGLWRLWDKDKPFIMFIGLNPSTASEYLDDPTIRRVKRFASDWGYGGVYMCNLFGFVTQYPQELKTCADPLGDNDRWLLSYKEICKDVLFAWGSFKESKERGLKVMSMFTNAVCLGINKDGSPKHPLYVSAKTLPLPIGEYK